MKHFKFKIISCNVIWREVCYFSALSNNQFGFEFLPYGLHCNPDLLRNDVQAAIDKTDGEYDAILLGYGLCSKGLEGIKARKVKLVITKGHDCITCFLGSRHRYRELFDSNPGRYWYTPGWIENHTPPGKERYENQLQEYTEIYGEENAQYLMDMEQEWLSKYSTATYIDLGVGNTTEYEKYTQNCSAYLNWKFERLEGDASLLKNLLNGGWNDDAYLIIPPGHAIKATHDESIMTIQKIEGQ